MTLLLHEVWQEPDGHDGWRTNFCLAGPDGDTFRQRLRPGSRCIRTFEANSPEHALYEFARYSGDAAPKMANQNPAPYPETWAIRQHGTLNATERTAYGYVAQALANHAYGWAEHESKTSQAFPGVGPIYCHLSDSTFEWTAQTLWRLKILRPLDFDPKMNWAHFFAFDCALVDARHVAMRNWTSGPLLSKLIENFIYLFGDYGTQYWGFSVDRQSPFGANGRLHSTLESLVPLGYLESSLGGFVWTELAAPLMYRTGYWPLPPIVSQMLIQPEPGNF